MRPSPHILTALLLASGCLGWLVKPASGNNTSTGTLTGRTPSQSGDNSRSTHQIVSELRALADSVTFDLSIEELVAGHSPCRLTELALWLADADSSGMERLWLAFHDSGKLDMKTADLIMKHWTARDPRRAIDVARETSNEHIAWWAWGQNDPENAFAACEKEAPGFLPNTLRGIGQKDPELARRLLEQHPQLAKSTAVQGIAEGLDNQDPLAALEFARRYGSSSSDALKDLVRADPDAAIDWLRNNRIQPYECSAALKMLVSHHPEKAAEFLETLPTGSLRSALLGEYVADLATRDRTAALEFAASQPGANLRATLFREVAEGIADPLERLAIYRQGLAAVKDAPRDETVPLQLDYYYQESLEELARVAPDETLEAVRSLEDTALTQRFFETWIHNNPTPAADWLVNQEPGWERDQFAALLASHFKPSAYRELFGGHAGDIEPSLAWAGFIDGPELREETTREVLGEWINQKPEETAAYFDSLPDDDPLLPIYETLNNREHE